MLLGLSFVNNEREARSHAMHNHPPRWWTSSHESSWNAAKRDALKFWTEQATDPSDAARHEAEQGIAFGFGGYHRYCDYPAWNDELAARLAVDWTDTHQGARSWAEALSTVRMGFEFASRLAARATPICL